MSKYLVVKGKTPDCIYRANTKKEVEVLRKELSNTYGKSKVQVFKLVKP